MYAPTKPYTKNMQILIKLHLIIPQAADLLLHLNCDESIITTIIIVIIVACPSLLLFSSLIYVPSSCYWPMLYVTLTVHILNRRMRPNSWCSCGWPVASVEFSSVYHPPSPPLHHLHSSSLRVIVMVRIMHEYVLSEFISHPWNK